MKEAARPISGQRWDAERYASNAAFVPALGLPVLELLAPQSGERVLDIGCGDGVLSARIAGAGAQVIGVDGSPQLVAAAVARGIDARVADAQRLAFDAEFDAVFSNAALHWMRDFDGVLAGVRRALRPGGRFIGEFGGQGNVASICTALLAALRMGGYAWPAPFPWFFPTVHEYTAALERHRFTVESIALLPRPTPLPTGIAGWLTTFGDPFLGAVPSDERATVLEAAIALLEPSLCDRSGAWTADYVRLRFRAQLY